MDYFNRNQAWPSSGAFSGIPEQAIPSSKKTKEWFKATMDAFEHEGLKQLDENQKYKDFYRMKDGKLSFMELKEIIPYLKDVQALRDGVSIPSFLKHYDILGTIINAFIGWLSNMSDKYNVVGLDDTEINQYTETKEGLLKMYIQEQFEKRLNQKLIEQGLDPTFNDFQSEEERQAYMQQIQEAKVALTPPEIEKFMNTKWRTVEVMWGSHTLDADRQRFYMDEMDDETYTDYLLTGKCFRNFHVGYDYYKPERWSPLNTFYSRTLDSKYPQYGEYIGRVHYYTATSIISRWGHLLTDKDKQKLVGGDTTYKGLVGTHHSGSYVSYTKQASLGAAYQNQVIPWKGYYDYASIKAYENYTGVPQGVYHGYDENGNQFERLRFMPNIEYGNYQNRAQMLTDDPVRSDLYQVTECYWVSPQRIYMVTYESESGLVTQQIVTDELLKEFLEENGIKKITRTMEKGVENPEVNTYFVDYVPQVRYGVKIAGGFVTDGPMYLDGEPIEAQIKGDSNLYDFVLPVAGYVGSSLAARIQPFQVFYNYAINQITNILENEIGAFFLSDINFIPSEYKELGEDVNEVWANLLEAAKATGILPIDTSAQNTKGGIPFNQFATYDLSQTQRLKMRMELAEWAKSKCFEMVGITSQVLMGPDKYETATGVQQGVSSSILQTKTYFENFENFKKRALDIHLAVAQQCQGDGKDISVMYTKSDMTRAYLQIGTDGLSMRHMGVQAIVNSKKREELEKFKNYMLQMNTAGGDIYDLASIFTADSTVELMQIARNSRLHNEKLQREQAAQQQQLQQQKIEADAQKMQAEFAHEEKLETIKGEYRILQERVQVAGRAADAKSDPASLNFLAQVSNQVSQEAQAEQKNVLENRKLDQAREAEMSKTQIEMEKLRLKEEELKQRRYETDANKYIAGINKN